MKQQILLDEKGMFTTTELLMVVMILAVVFGAMFDLLYFGERQWRKTSQEADARQNGRLAVSRITRELRAAQSPSSSEYGISQADRCEIKFYADYNAATGPERIHYYLNGNSLMRGELNSSTSEEPWVYSGTEQAGQLAQYVRNTTSTPIFRYYDKNSSELTNLPLSLSDRKQVRIIEVSVLVDVKTVEAPNAFTIDSQAQLRNLRD